MKTNSFLTVYVIIISFFLLNVPINAQEMFAGKRIIAGTFEGKTISYVDGEIAIKLREGFQKESISDALLNLNALVKQDFDELGWGLIELSQGTDIIPIIKMLKRSNEVQYAEPNQILSAHQTEPNDPYFKGTSPATYRYQWGLHNISQSPPAGIYDSDIDATEVWDLSTGGSDVIIAILDTGIPMLNGSLSHPDLDDPNKIILGPDYVDLPGTPEYQEGVRDRRGHGTHVAGIVAAETNNSTGVAGTAWNCKLMIIQVFNSSGNGTDLTFYNGVKYAVDYKRNNPSKRVAINFSGGGGSPTSNLQAAVEYANTYGVAIIASTGNNDPSIRYPAAYSTSYSNVIAVGAIDQNDVRSSYSDYGPQINVVAPGGYGDSFDSNDIFSTTPNYSFVLESSGVGRTYGYLAGTSMAAPFVSGTVALMLSVNSSLTPSQIRDVLQQNADDKGATGFDYYYGHGRINTVKAVSKSYSLANPNYYYTIDTAPLNFYDSNFNMTFTSGPIPGVLAAGAYTVDRYYIDVTRGNFISTPQAWYTAPYGYSWASPNNATRWLFKETTSSSVRFKTVFYFIKTCYPPCGQINLWAPFDPNTALNREFITLGIPPIPPVIDHFVQSPNPICKGGSGSVRAYLSQGNPTPTYTWTKIDGPASFEILNTTGNPCYVAYNYTGMLSPDDVTDAVIQCTATINGVGSDTKNYIVELVNSCPSCPTLAFNVGGEMTNDNPMLITSLSNPGVDVTDYYLLQNPITPVGNKINLRIHEPQTEHTWLDYVELIEAKIKSDELVAVNDEGEVINYKNNTAPFTVLLNGTTDITEILSSMDTLDIDLNEGDIITIQRNIQAPENDGDGDLVLGGTDPIKDQESITLSLANTEDIEGENPKLGDLTFFFRPNKSIIAKKLRNLPPGNIEITINQELTLNYLTIVRNLKTARVNTLSLLSATHQQSGDVKNLLTGIDQSYAEILPGDMINFEFQKGIIPAEKREYILKSVGRYETDTTSAFNKLAGTGEENLIPKENKLYDNYPNPFNPITQIKYSVKENGLVTLQVYDILGKEVAALVNEEKQAGTYTVTFDAGSMASGIYFYTITANNFQKTKKMLLIK
ncbi:MAG: S8 family peptidase [Ignavibacteriaceae bacterium]|nr:S8 family peptidase [Ignavibacteriaceae bacterium]